MRAEGGQASVEYTALLLLVAMLLGGIVAAGKAPPEPSIWLAGAMCRAWKGGACSGGAPTGRSSGSAG